MNPTEVSEKIIAAYRERLRELPRSKRRHFLYRAWVSTGDAAIWQQLEDESRLSSLKAAERAVADYQRDRTSFVEHKAQETQGYECKKINDWTKKEQWLAHPLLLAYSSVLWTQYYQRLFKEPVQLINDAEAFQELLASPDFIRWAVVAATNMTYLAFNLGAADHLQDYERLFREVFESSDLNDDVIFTNYIYGLTHICIGRSDFYRRGVDKERYDWVRHELQRWSEESYRRLTLDVNAEVALCLCLLGQADDPIVGRIQQRLLDAFDTKAGYIQRESHSTFEFAEHTNAVAILLFNHSKWIPNLQP